MVTVHPETEGRYRLTTAAGREIGWIRGRALRFTGFRSEGHVMEVVRQAWLALQDVLRREAARGTRYVPNMSGLKLVHDGAYEWISDGRLPVARLYRPRTADPDASFAIELVVPSDASEGLVLEAAKAIARAIGGAASARPFIGSPPLDAA